jgi:hypothetical protein
MPVRTALFALALALPLAAGCAPPKLDESRTWTMGAGEANSIDLPAITKPQKVTAEFTSTAADVTVLIIKESDAPGQKGLETVDEGKAITKQKGKSGTITADVPANTATRVVVTGANSKTEVTVKATNSK